MAADETQKTGMGKGTYQGSIGDRTDIAKPTFGTSLKEQMAQRNLEIARAMHLLDASIDGVAASVADLADSTIPDQKVFRPPSISGSNSRLPKELGLAGDISRVAYRLRLLQAAVDRATRRVRQKSSQRFETLNPSKSDHLGQQSLQAFEQLRR